MGAPMLRRSSELYALELLAMTVREGLLPAALLSKLSSDWALSIPAPTHAVPVRSACQL